MSDPISQRVLGDIFRPPPKGDVTLRSSDSVEFQAHSAILNLASPVFEGLSVVGTAKDVVELSETAETISLMLRFIYPNEKTPIITSFEMFSKCLEAAHKYDLGGMLGTLDDQLAVNTHSQSLIQQDPLRAYGLSVQFSLPSTKAAATPLVVTSKTDFSDPQSLADLLKSHPSTSVVRLAAIQGTRGKMIADVLFQFHWPPNTFAAQQSNVLDRLSCDSCSKWLATCHHFNVRRQLPSWVLAWINLTYQTLLHSSLEQSVELFEWNILRKLQGEGGVCPQCLSGVLRSHEKGKLFDGWSQIVKVHLEQRLEGLGHLYAL
ncbi:hypothetical protein BDV93DRAFT_544716 [Ceratobasidium sp. AG-I]|nr:hypothetical protein BDV93DRAFT_544716 [Ceratobasidium sp. AG-I]